MGTVSGRHQIDFGGHPQRAEHFTAIFPSETKSAHVSETEATHDVRRSLGRLKT